MAGWWLEAALLPFRREMQIFSQRFQTRGSDIQASKLFFVLLVSQWVLEKTKKGNDIKWAATRSGSHVVV
jgi:hypothetical protein